MNILFHIDMECVPQHGGIERVTSLIGMELKRRGHHVYSSYSIPVEGDEPRPDFDASIHLRPRDTEKLSKFISEKKIDCIVVQKVFRDLPWIHEAVRLSGREVKIIYCLHKNPQRTEGIAGLRGLIFNDSSPLNILKVPFKILLHPIRKREYDRQQYQWPAIYADKILVLSDQYIEPWLDISEGLGRDKISAMPNPLSFDPHTTPEDIRRKERKVLIVARMHERQKNITEALNIWKEIMKQPDLQDWTLEIVGDGPHREQVEKAARGLGVRNVSFHGYRDPRPYFEKSAIFMMTSRFEGWPMTINEAMQYGCVPLVYTSFAAIHDVVSNGSDGFLITPFRTAEYVEKLMLLMRDKSLREAMAEEAVKSSDRFGLAPIVDRWEKVISDK